MNDERYVAALEISSAKIIGLVGRINNSGQLDIIAVEQEKGVESVRYGVIQNLDDTALRISRIIERLERRPSVSPRKIRSLFVGLSGRSVRSIPTSVKLNLPDESEITDDIIERLRNDALSVDIDNSLEVVDAVPRKYRVGKIETTSPKGTIGSEIRADFDIIVCRPELKRNIQRVLQDKVGIKIEGFVVTALATGLVILTPEQKRLGCMMADIGAETTTVTIYRNGSLNYFATIPLGGRHITRDLTNLSLLEEHAEEIKLTSGNAIAPDTPSTLNVNGVKQSDVSNYIVARAEEIVANIAEQLTFAGVKEKELPVGVICIGGGARLNGMIELVSRQVGMSAKSGRLPSYIRVEDVKGPSSELLQAASVLYAGATATNNECLEIPRQEELPKIGEAPEPEKEQPQSPEQEKNPNRFAEKFKRGLSRLFSPPEDNDSDIL